MLRRSMLLLTTVIALASGCGRGGSAEATHPPAPTAHSQPFEELRSIPDEIQAEVDRVLQPIADVDVVIDQVTSMPTTLDVDAGHLRRLAAASLRDDAEPTVDLEATADARAEVQEVLAKIHDIAADLRRTPDRVRSASGNIEALGTRAATLASSLTAELQARLADPRLRPSDTARLQAELELVATLDADIQALAAQAELAVSAMPSRGEHALTKLTTAFAAGA